MKPVWGVFGRWNTGCSAQRFSDRTGTPFLNWFMRTSGVNNPNKKGKKRASVEEKLKNE